MTRIQLACFGLIASAFTLAALLVANFDTSLRLESQAQAEMVISRDNFTIMTAKTRNGEEALFVLDNANGRLMIYRLDMGRKQLQIAEAIEMETLFSRASGGGSDSGSRSRGKR